MPWRKTRLRAAFMQCASAKVMLDADLAALYGVPTKVLSQAVKRNATRGYKLEVTNCDFKFVGRATQARHRLH